LDGLREAVVRHGADLGVAHDGDADRCLAVDAAGHEVDGDQILAVLALAMKEAGQLRKDTVVATVMSNLGFKLAMERAGVEL
ncbi:phosphoglucosamine mutase, partial [Streptomyces nanshensis]